MNPEIISVRYMPDENCILFAGGVQVLRLFDEYAELQLQMKCEEFNEDDNKLKEEVIYDHITVVDRREISAIWTGYSNKTKMYSITLVSSTESTLMVRVSERKEVFQIHNKVMTWRYPEKTSK